MGRVVLAFALVAAASGLAVAGSTRKVEVVTDPPGATVYLNSPEDGAVCQATPCTIDAPLGSTPIIVQLAKYEPIIETLEVKRSRDKKSMQVHYKLISAVGTIVIDAASAKGASVRVDDEDKGKAPARIDTDAGAHHVVVAMSGKTLYDDIINLETGQELEIPIKNAVAEREPDPDDRDAGTEITNGGGGGDTKIAVPQPHPAKPRRRFISAGAVADVGMRHFAYVAPKNGLPQTEDELGQVMVGPAVELWPGELPGVPRLRGLSLYARLELGLNQQDVMKGAAGLKTYWGSFEVSVRQRWTLGGALGIELSGGFARDQMQFSAAKASDLLQVPSADYHTLRYGLRAALAGTIEPYVAGEGRIVLSGGDLPSRFDQASGSGFRGALGVQTKRGAFALRAEASYLRYTWTFHYDGVNDVAQADGATDAVMMLSLGAGFQY